MELFIYFLVPLGLTIIIETIIAFSYGIHTMRDLSVIILAQILTNPVVNFGAILVYQSMNATYYGLYLFTIETIVLFTESTVYKYCLSPSQISPFHLSALCNLTSFAIGILWGLVIVV